MNELDNQCQRIAQALFENCQDGATRSHLRQLLQDIPESQIRAMRYLRNLPKRSRVNQKLLYLVAGLIAEYPCPLPDQQLSFGASLVKLSHHSDINATGIERRFELLLQLEQESLVQQLHGLIVQAKGSKIPVDYGKLLYDLHFWNNNERNGRTVQLDWAKDFWCPKDSEKDQKPD